MAGSGLASDRSLAEPLLLNNDLPLLFEEEGLFLPNSPLPKLAFCCTTGLAEPRLLQGDRSDLSLLPRVTRSLLRPEMDFSVIRFQRFLMVEVVGLVVITYSDKALSASFPSSWGSGVLHTLTTSGADVDNLMLGDGNSLRTSISSSCGSWSFAFTSFMSGSSSFDSGSSSNQLGEEGHSFPFSSARGLLWLSFSSELCVELSSSLARFG